MNLSEHQETKLQERGHIHWIDKKTNNIYKIYKKFNLLDNLKDIEKRLSQIVKLSYSMDFIPQTNYFYEEDLLVMKQKYLINKKKLKEINPSKKISLIKKFSQSLDRLYEEGFVHGDINRKNIIYYRNSLFLVDFEPSLLQLKNQTKQWMSTRPYRYHEDIQNNNITVKSDFLGFACFTKWFLFNTNCPQHYAEECSKIITKLKFQSSPFQNLTKLLVS
jgi:serine/threonine protein kinase